MPNQVVMLNEGKDNNNLKDLTIIKFIKKQVLRMYLNTYRINRLSALTAAVVVKRTKNRLKEGKRKKNVMQTEWDRRLSIQVSLH